MAPYSSILGWENPMDRRTCLVTVRGVAESVTTQQLTLKSLGVFLSHHRYKTEVTKVHYNVCYKGVYIIKSLNNV